jgi:hypothetical protein
MAGVIWICNIKYDNAQTNCGVKIITRVLSLSLFVIYHEYIYRGYIYLVYAVILRIRSSSCNNVNSIKYVVYIILYILRSNVRMYY